MVVPSTPGYTQHYIHGTSRRGQNGVIKGHAPSPTFLVRGRVGVTGNICGEASIVQREKGHVDRDVSSGGKSQCWQSGMREGCKVWIMILLPLLSL